MAKRMRVERQRQLHARSALALLLWCCPCAAGASEEPVVAPVRAALIAEHASIQPGGTTRVGVHFEMEAGWHIYADPPGDAGLPTTIRWSSPMKEARVVFGPLRWPPHQPFIDPGDIRTFGYTGSLVLDSTLQLMPSKVRGATVPILAEVRWLACKDLCIPGSTALNLTLPVSHTPQTPSPHAHLFEAP